MIGRESKGKAQSRCRDRGHFVSGVKIRLRELVLTWLLGVSAWRYLLDIGIGIRKETEDVFLLRRGRLSTLQNRRGHNILANSPKKKVRRIVALLWRETLTTFRSLTLPSENFDAQEIYIAVSYISLQSLNHPARLSFPVLPLQFSLLPLKLLVSLSTQSFPSYQTHQHPPTTSTPTPPPKCISHSPPSSP